MGRTFTVQTDHWNLKFLLDQRLTTIPQHTWVSKLFGYDFVVEYRPGKQNVAADALSRRDEESLAVHAISVPQFSIFDDLRAELANHCKARELRQQLGVGTAPSGWSEVDGLLLFQGKVFLPDDSKLWQRLLQDAHEMGHEGAEKTLHCLRSSFYNAHMTRRVREFVKGCSTCQRNKSEHLHPAGLLQPLPIPHNVWSDIAMNFVEGLPKVGGKSVILTVVDGFLSLLTLLHSVTLTRQIQLQGPSSTILCGSMVSHVLLSVIATRFSLVIFGQNCFVWRV